MARLLSLHLLDARAPVTTRWAWKPSRGQHIQIVDILPGPRLRQAYGPGSNYAAMGLSPRVCRHGAEPNHQALSWWSTGTCWVSGVRVQSPPQPNVLVVVEVWRSCSHVAVRRTPSGCVPPTGLGPVRVLERSYARFWLGSTMRVGV